MTVAGDRKIRIQRHCVYCGQPGSLIKVGSVLAHSLCIPSELLPAAGADVRIKQQAAMIKLHDEVIQQMRLDIIVLQEALRVRQMVTLRADEALRRRKAG